MSHPLYDDDEQVTCMCSKCGWFGTTEAPMFLCGGCEKYVTRPIDLDERRRKAAEARCARLEKALEAALEVMEFAYMNAPKQPKEIGIARAALQQETGATEKELPEDTELFECGGSPREGKWD